jgi:hypothetical protein
VHEFSCHESEVPVVDPVFLAKAWEDEGFDIAQCAEDSVA